MCTCPNTPVPSHLVPPVRSIAILFHERARHDAERGNYRLWAMVSNWRARGIRVELLFGPGQRAKALECDVLFPHVDLSYLPDPYWNLMQEHPRVVNRRVRDIRKHVISRQRVGPDDPWDGPVIIKTTNNCGGFTDAWFGPANGPSLIRRARTRLGRIDWIEDWCVRRGWAKTLTKYPILPSLRDVPRAVFASPDLVVEKFIPERDGSQYVMRMWIVMGDRSIGRILRSDDPYVKNSNGALGEFHEPPPGLAERRKELDLDYGKMDFVMHAGRAVLIDVNVTPTVTGDARSEQYRALNEDFSRGIEAVT
jgi:hypothetical protein